MIQSFYERVLPVVVLYKQSILESLTLQSLNEDLKALDMRMDVFIYDNSPDSEIKEEYFNWNNFNIYYYHDAHNSGLSKAYNTGSKKATALQKEWLLLLDQDTTFSAGFFQNYYNAATTNLKTQLFAPLLKLHNGVIFSPCIAKHKRGYPPRHISPGNHSLWKYSPVNSGMLVRLKLFLEAGGYNENVKVDFCDFQFLEMVRRIYSTFYLTTATGKQDYSNFEMSIEKQKHRFEIYLEDAKNCEKPTLSDKIGFFYTVTRHTVGLSLKLKSFLFISLYLRRFLFK